MPNPEARLILRLHSPVTLYKGVSHPPDLYAENAQGLIVAVYPLHEQELSSGYLALGHMQEQKNKELQETEKVYAAFIEKYLSDITTALPIIEALARDKKTSMTTRQTALINLMISGIFFNNAEILGPEILT
jgi:hypothetical protein